MGWSMYMRLYRWYPDNIYTLSFSPLLYCSRLDMLTHLLRALQATLWTRTWMSTPLRSHLHACYATVPSFTTAKKKINDKIARPCLPTIIWEYACSARINNLHNLTMSMYRWTFYATPSCQRGYNLCQNDHMQIVGSFSKSWIVGNLLFFVSS